MIIGVQVAQTGKIYRCISSTATCRRAPEALRQVAVEDIILEHHVTAMLVNKRDTIVQGDAGADG